MSNPGSNSYWGSKIPLLLFTFACTILMYYVMRKMKWEIVAPQGMCSIPKHLFISTFDRVPLVEHQFNCSKHFCEQLLLVNWTDLSLKPNVTAFSALGLNNITCLYRWFGLSCNSGNLKYGSWQTLKLTGRKLLLDQDFTEVECLNNVMIVCKRVYFGFKNRTTQPVRSTTNSTTASSDNFNVVLLVLDNMSPYMFHKFLNRSSSLLKSWSNAFEFQFHHKVGVNSIPNTVAITTGLTYENETDFIERFDKLNNSQLQYHDIVWKLFAERGYKTYFSNDERKLWYLDWAWTALINKHKFDYNWWPFFKHISSQRGIFKYLCLAESPRIVKQWEHLHECTKRFASDKLFVYDHVAELTHNIPFEDMPKLDKPLYNLLTSWKEEGFLNKTILFLLGDHGTKYTPAEYKNTTAQRLQENLPLLYIVLPDSFIEQHPRKLAHLLVNRFKVTSQFDIHATLLSLLQMDENTKSALQQQLYGRNLFDDIGERRACSDANIPDEFCSCF